ncbi:MAG: hypothetical protein PSV13_17105 [Lacunisphaera sp.]|nr:hypothetical protein [Lacunisphaera sp.]
MRTDLQQLVAELPATGIARASRLGLALGPQLDQDSWRQLVAHLARLTRTTTGARQTLTAWLGDALAYGELSCRGRITTCASEAGLEPGTLRNAKMVCGRIPVSCRHDALTWTHHCEVGLAFADPGEIEQWLRLAEEEKLTTGDLRRRIRAHQARARNIAVKAPSLRSVVIFQLMRDLRATCRMLGQNRDLWRHWSPAAAQSALQELRDLPDFVDELRARALGRVFVPRDPQAN